MAPGPDLDFSTASCAGPPAGDDLGIALGAVAYDAAARAATMTAGTGRPLADGLYRLLVCEPVADLAGHRLDGDVPSARTLPNGRDPC